MLNTRLISRLRRIDWDFPGTPSDSPFSAIHWHPARLPSQIAATLIGLLTDPGDTVLDPFVGSGTSAIEAQRLDRRSIGFDLNPIACTMTRAKILVYSAGRVEKLCYELKARAEDAVAAQLLFPADQSLVPGTVQGKWYTRRVSRELASLWKMLTETSGPQRLLANTAFSAILLPVCRETRHWGYVCDNSTPKGDHEGRPLAEFCRVLDRLVSGYVDRDADRNARGMTGVPSPARIRCGDSSTLLGTIPPNSIDLVITSPPYFGVSDYIKSQRLSMEWFGVDIEPLRLSEIGARSKRHRVSATIEYIEGLASIFTSVRPCIKPGAACAVIIGESKSRRSLFSEFVGMMSAIGFDLVLESCRRVSAQRRQHAVIAEEKLLIFTLD